MSFGEIERLALFVLAGLVLGGVSFATLRINTAYYFGGGLWRPIGLHFARLTLLTVAFIGLAREGAGPLLAAAAGLALARPIVVPILARSR